MSRSTVSRPRSETAIPAASWPRCCRREEAEVGEPRDVALGGADAEDAAHLAVRLPSSVRGTPSSESPPTSPSLRRTPPRRLATSGGHASTPGRRPRRTRRAGRPAGHSRRRPSERGLRQRDREPAERDVVDERATGGASGELDSAPRRRSSRPGGRRPRRRPGTRSPESATGDAPASRTTSPRATPRHRAHVLEQPTQPTTGVGSIARRPSRCRARRCPRRSGSPSASQASAIPRSTRRAPTRSAPSRGCRS
jgi:hypothetical protein